MRKIPFAGVEFTSQRVRGLRGTSELPGRQYIQYTILCSHVASNSVLFAESGDNTSAARQQGEELLGETHGRRNRRRNVYAYLEM